MFDRSRVREVREQLDTALALLSTQIGLNVSLDGSVRFTDDEMTFKVKVTPSSTDGKQVPQIEVDFAKYATRYGLSPDDLGRTFTSVGKSFKLVGMKPNATVNKMVGESPTGKRYVFPVSEVKNNLIGKRTEAQILAAIRRVENMMSPENLHQDGEATRQHVIAQSAKLRRERAELVKELGREPSTQEIYSNV
jgi:hypothetical protein